MMTLDAGWLDARRIGHPGGALSEAPVNVSQVRQLSPFRYPGGNTWCVPQIKKWLLASMRPQLFIEPFAGGAIASLTVAAENLADHVIMCELDEEVASVWRVVFEPSALNFEWLTDKILSFEMSRSNAVAALSQRPRNLRERAFATVLRNRVNRGGIMAPGASLQKSGENGKGIASRWYAHTLVNRLAAIRMLRDKITFVHCDGVKFIGQHISEIDTAFFIDPPYTAGGKRAGSRLYVHNALDHDNLFDAMARVRGSFLMTYDDADEVRAMAKVRNFTVNEIAMKSTHHAVNVELLITNEAIG